MTFDDFVETAISTAQRHEDDMPVGGVFMETLNWVNEYVLRKNPFSIADVKSFSDPRLEEWLLMCDLLWPKKINAIA